MLSISACNLMLQENSISQPALPYQNHLSPSHSPPALDLCNPSHLELPPESAPLNHSHFWAPRRALLKDQAWDHLLTGITSIGGAGCSHHSGPQPVSLEPLNCWVSLGFAGEWALLNCVLGEPPNPSLPCPSSADGLASFRTKAKEESHQLQPLSVFWPILFGLLRDANNLFVFVHPFALLSCLKTGVLLHTLRWRINDGSSWGTLRQIFEDLRTLLKDLLLCG